MALEEKQWDNMWWPGLVSGEGHAFLCERAG